MRLLRTLLTASAFACMWQLPFADAQTSWPEKPVKIIVNFAPGGSPDNTARAYAERLTEALNRPFIIEKLE